MLTIAAGVFLGMTAWTVVGLGVYWLLCRMQS
jgi:hypothetical protein